MLNINNSKFKIFLLICFIMVLSGCSVNYNLKISGNKFTESVDVIYNNNENVVKYNIFSHYDIIDFEDPNFNVFEKKDGYSYYDIKSINKNKINYSYSFKDNDIVNSNFINASYNSFILNRYDHDEDGKKDYMILTTDDSFKLFDRYNKIDDVIVNITCNYKVISSNADKVHKNIYTWYLDRNNIKAINLVYNPDKPVDYRNILERIIDGDYLNLFTVSIVLFCLGIILYFKLKKKSNKVNKI